MSNFINVRFPSLNKNAFLEENDAEIKKRSNVQKARIMKRIIVGDAVYNCMANEFLSDVNDCLYEQIGGQRSDDERLEGIENFTTILNDPKLKEIFMQTSYTMVVEVKNSDTGDKFYVNTEGHKYARYVGREA